MNADKRKALEAAGWKFGSADEFLCERPMSDDKMRAEFETWASIYGFDLRRSVDDWYFCLETRSEWITWRAAYAAGRKAEREAMQLKNWDGLRLG